MGRDRGLIIARTGKAWPKSICPVLADDLPLLPQEILKLTTRQQAQLRRPRPFLFLAVLAVFGLPWFVLFRTGVQARRAAVEMDAAAAVFLAQFSQQPQNAAAKRFDRLAADLGFVPNSANGLLRVNITAEQDYREVEGLLDEFLQLQAASLLPATVSMPAELTQYLNDYNVPLAAIQTELLEREAPLWEVDFERMSETRYSMPGFLNALNVQKLLLLSVVVHYRSGQIAQMERALEASWRLNQAIATRSDLVSQLLVSLTTEKQAGILRHIDAMPAEFYETWQVRFGEASQRGTAALANGLQFDAWLQYTTLQGSLSRMTGGASKKSPSIDASVDLVSTLSYWFSPAYYFSLSNVDTNAASQRALERLSRLDLCEVTRSEVLRQLDLEKTAVWNKTVVPSETLARRWKDAGDRALAIELTQKVLLVKQLAQSDQWTEAMPDLRSEVCPGKSWVYEVDDDGTASLSFSIQMDSKALVPLTYHFDLSSD